MAKPEFPFPDPDPQDIAFYEVKDGMRVDDNVWNRERNCQLQRQKLYYQSLCEPGIVCGLRVRVNNTLLQDEDEKNNHIFCLEVEEGLAIDAEGNFLILTDEALRCFKVNLNAILKQKPEEANPTYVRGLYISGTQRKPTQSFPDDRDTQLLPRVLIYNCKVELGVPEKSQGLVELCRITIDKNSLKDGLTSCPKSFFLPGRNELDFRRRRYFQPRPIKVFQVGLVKMGDQDVSLVEKSFRDLMTAADALYPNLVIKPVFHVIEIPEHPAKNQDRGDLIDAPQLSIVKDCDCLFWKIDPKTLKTRTQKNDDNKGEDTNQDGEAKNTNSSLDHKPNLSKFQFQRLKVHLNEGAFLWIEDCSDSKAELAVFKTLERFESQDTDEDNDDDTSSSGESSNQAGTWQPLEPVHPIYTTPFAFQMLPDLPDASNENTDKKLVTFEHSSRMLLCHGELSLGWLSSAYQASQWGPQTKLPKLNLSRSEIRDAQELGINIINFIWDLQQVRGFQIESKESDEQDS
ncbi:hypothetical protein [Sodalinema gerasimenkoae]|uniref:hypothetical protein n=1 Tax=Sodalinema gerasimenkoae TaxID=2862348 RepID=UPI00135C0176|nr:hypothetical protein [Sodalinema gerasimenkoae]